MRSNLSDDGYQVIHFFKQSEYEWHDLVGIVGVIPSRLRLLQLNEKQCVVRPQSLPHEHLHREEVGGRYRHVYAVLSSVCGETQFPDWQWSLESMQEV